MTAVELGDPSIAVGRERQHRAGDVAGHRRMIADAAAGRNPCLARAGAIPAASSSVEAIETVV